MARFLERLKCLEATIEALRPKRIRVIHVSWDRRVGKPEIPDPHTLYIDWPENEHTESAPIGDITP